MSSEEKPLVDLSLIRADLVEIISKSDKIKQVGIQTYMKDNPPTFDFVDIVQRAELANRLYLLERKEPKSVLSEEELHYLVGLERYSTEYDCEKNPDLELPKDANIEPIMIGSIPAEWQTTPGVTEDTVILYFHGGAFYTCSPKTHRRMTLHIGRAASMKVLSVDYRLAPEHPFPAALEDCYQAYNWLIGQGYDPSKIVIAGDSAGGYLVLSTLLKLRDERMQLPAAGVCIAPVTDLTASHNSIFDNVKTDPLIAPLGIYWVLEMFLGNADPNDKAVSPLFAELDGLPPLLFHVSKIEMLYSDSERFVEKARTAGINVQYSEWDDMTHVFHWYDIPEAKDAIEEIGSFVKEKVK